MLDKLKRPLCVFDLETTSPEPATARIVQIGVRKIFPDGRLEDKKMLINPEIPIPAEATEVHKITDEMVKDAPTLRQVAKGIVAFINDSDFATYNGRRFDVKVLFEELLRCGIELSLDRLILDAYIIFTKLYPRKLEDAYKLFCGKTLEGAHDAFNDVVATHEVLFSQVELYPDLSALSMEELNDYCTSDHEREKPPLDIHGKFYLKDGDAYFTSGKYKDQRIDLRKHSQYLDWIISEKCDYAYSTKRMADKLLNPNKPHQQASLF